MILKSLEIRVHRVRVGTSPGIFHESGTTSYYRQGVVTVQYITAFSDKLVNVSHLQAEHTIKRTSSKSWPKLDNSVCTTPARALKPILMQIGLLTSSKRGSSGHSGMV